MDENRSPVYGLYLVRPEDIPEGETRYMLTAGWCLLYTSGEKPKHSEEITDLNLLPADANMWLRRQIYELRMEYAKAHKRELLDRAGVFTAAFESELAKEREKLRTSEEG